MCLAVPYRVMRSDGVSATVEFAGRCREVSLLLLGEPVAPGDYVLVPVGNFAAERLDPETGRQTLALLGELAMAAA